VRFLNNAFCLLFALSLLFSASTLPAATYDDDTLEIFSKLLPRFVLMSSQKDKLKDEISICVLHNAVDENSAASLIGKVNKNYPDGIKTYKITLISSNYSDIDSCLNTQLLFIFNSDGKDIKKSIEFSKNNGALTISYDSILLKEGIGASLFLGRKVTPYINVSAIRKSGIELNNVLLRISKIYSEDDK
jgi:hypothetical protein